MAILDGDIQLLKSEVMDDVDEGGGAATGTAVSDGVSNNMFTDISELDRTYGRISLRKVFPAVVTDNTDTYFGAHVIVAEPPSDPKVSVALFSTKNWFDKRTDARNKLESYISGSTEGRWALLGNHLSGQRAVQMHCDSSAPTPGVDSVLKLQVYGSDTQSQYVRISRIVSRTPTTFEDSRGFFSRDVITLEISDALRFNFPAAPLERYSAYWYSQPTRIYTTIAADASSYFGVQPLRIAAALGDLTIKAQSIYTQLVPSALSETPLTDVRCIGNRTLNVPITGAPAISFNVGDVGLGVGVVKMVYAGCPIAAGSVSINLGAVTVTDDGQGNLNPTGGYQGTVDYTSGAIAISNNQVGTYADMTVTVSPAAAVSAASRTSSTAITLGNRGYTYVKALSPVPAPGSVEVSYMAQGKWYSLSDDGNGSLVGEQGTGGGSINYATGSVVVTPGALPDVDTSIMFSWGSNTQFASYYGSSVLAAPSIVLNIPNGAISPGSVTITYTAGGAQRTCTDNSAGGIVGTGAGTGGYIDYANGKVVLVPAYLPDANSTVSVNYTQGLSVSETHTAGGAVTNFTTAHPIKPGTLALAFSDTAGTSYLVGDNGSGSLVVRRASNAAVGGGYDLRGQLQAGLIRQGISSWAGLSGSVNYATGAISVGVTVQISQSYFTGVAFLTTTLEAYAAGAMSVSYRQASDTDGGPLNHSVPVPALSVGLLPTVTNSIVPGSLRFTIGSDVFVDRSGVIYRNVNHSTNSGISAGTINYLTGELELSSFAGGIAPTITTSMLTRLGEWTEWQASFRTSGAPIQNSSFYVSAVRADTSAVLSGSANASGFISGTKVDGIVDSSTGVAYVRFGEMVTAAGNELEDWYDPANVVSGQIFKPLQVMPETIKYNAVAVSSLPLSAEVLGLDPVRLPADGRVPIFRKGDVVVVHHTDTTTPATASNGQTVNLGRTRLSKVRVIGNDGNTITGGYTHDLDAGTVTFSNVSGYSQPVHIEHRIEDMVLVSDVQINGEMKITRPLTHNFPLGSYVSSALIIGDLKARVSVFFDQQTWNGWYDTLQGNNATGTYNKAQYPVEVSNRGCIQERWNIVFTNTTTVNVVGENVGQILSGVSTTSDIAPINPATGTPYFTLKALGWGAGWSAGNVLRFNTTAANFPVSVARTVLQGNPTVSNDSFALGIRGDIDA